MANPAVLPDSVFDDTPEQIPAVSVTANPRVLPDSVFDNSAAQPVQAAATAQPNLTPNSFSLPDVNYSEQLKTLATAAKHLPSDVVAGLAQMGHGLLNAPHNIVSSLNPSLGAAIPSQQNYNFSALAGNPNPTTADKLIQGGAQYLPYALGGEAALAGRAPSLLSSLAASSGSGAGFGLTQSDTPFTSAAEGAGLNALTTGAGAAIAGLPNAFNNYLSRFAATGLASRVANTMEGIKNATNAQAFQLAKNNYNNYSSAENDAWNNLTDQAAQADASGAKFDNSDYVKSLQDELSNKQTQSERQSGFSRANQDSQQLLNGYINDQHGTFQDAIEHNKALNQDYQNEITPGKSLPFNTVNFAKSNIKQAINDNLASNNLQDTLGQAWDDANNSTAQKNQIFNQLATPRGGNQISSFSQLIKNNSQNADPTTFINDYLPTSRGDGTQKMQQFSQMLGDEDQAKNILKMNYFDKTFNNSGDRVNVPQFLNRYNNLSADQQNYLFNPDENSLIQSLNKVTDKYPGALKQTGPISALGHATVPAFLGALASHHLGAGELLGGLAGAGAANLAGRGVQQLFSSQPISDYFVKQLMKPSGATINPALTALGRNAIPAATLPYLLGGQQ